MSNVWSPFISFRKPPNGVGNKILLTDPWQCKRVLIGCRDLIEYLAADFVQRPLKKRLKAIEGAMQCPAPDVSEDDKIFADHWLHRQWHPALDYYLWSRRGKYYDEHDLTGERRRKAIQLYQKDEACPPRIIPTGEQLSLPEPEELPEKLTLGTCLMQRRTLRHYVNRPVECSVLSTILWHGLKEVRFFRNRPITDPIDYLKSHGSGLDFYLVIYSVTGLSPGVYYYDAANHKIVKLREGLFRKEMFSILQNMPGPMTAAWTVVMTADFAQYQWRYRHERALRHLYLESGRIAQKLLLTGIAYRLGTLVTPATKDRQASALIGIDPVRQSPLYTLTMGLDGRSMPGASQ